MVDDPIREAARNAHKAGLAVVPPKEDGTKRPDVGEWTTYQRRRPTAEELRAWYAEGRGGVGIVMGAVSGGLETIEFDDRPAYERYLEIAQGTGLGDVVTRIRAGYEEATPGGGIHWPYRCAEIVGNTTLAQRPIPEEPQKRKTLIQTRGEGGYLVVAPSNGRVHPTGGAYRLLSGGFGTIATISPEERRGLWDLARTFDECPRPAREEPSAPAAGGGNRPGDDFNRRATWDEILIPHDWVLVHERGGVGYWRRPGKGRGISATTNHAGSGFFYPFTSSTVFDAERGYSKFACYAILGYGGDFRAAADALGKTGYGAPLPPGRLGKGGGGETPADGGLRLDGLTIVANDPRLWRVTVNGRTLEAVPTADLLSFGRFQAHCVEVLGVLPTLPPERGISEQRQWKAFIAPLIEAAEEEDIPEETTEMGRLKEMVERYVHDIDRHSDRRTDLPQGRILVHEGALHFRMPDLVQYLGEHGFDRKGLGSRIWSGVLRPAGAVSATVRADAATVVRVVRLPWIVGDAESVTPGGGVSQEVLQIPPVTAPKVTL